MKKKIVVMLVFVILVMMIMPVAYAVTPIEVDCPDTALNHALHDILGTAYTEPLLDTQLMMVTGLLNLSSKGIQDITGLEYLTGVDVFILTYNEIETLTPAFCEMVASHTVEALVLTGNKLKSLPSSLGGSGLKSLFIDDNSFYSLPSCVINITSLERIYFSRNRISRVPSALADMPNLETILMDGNRIRNLPSSFSGKTFAHFLCQYNFIDISPGSSNKNILDSMTITGALKYENQLPVLQNLTVEYPDTGVAKFSWDPGSDITFADNREAEFSRITILLDGDYVDNLPPESTEFIVEGLETGTEYVYSFAFDYTVLIPVYSGHYIRSYEKITAIPGDFTEPTPEPTPAITPDPTPLSTLEETPQVTTAPTPEMTAEEQEEPVEETQAPANSIQLSTSILIMVVSALVFTLILVLAIILIKRNNNRKKD
jgi:hypothetical protein